MKVTISPGNTKIGRTPNISFLPGLTCQSDVPCKRNCYAVKACRSWAEVVSSWANNSMLWAMRPDLFWKQIDEWSEARSRKPPEYFRWFVGGDIPSLSFYEGMVVLADKNPRTKFLAFTKNGDVVQHHLFRGHPVNLVLFFSAWPGWRTDQTATIQSAGGNVAWFQQKDGPEERIQYYEKTCIKCPGKCQACRQCWNPKPGQGVIFHEH